MRERQQMEKVEERRELLMVLGRVRRGVTLFSAINTVHERVIVRIAEEAFASHHIKRIIEWISIVALVIATLCITSKDDLFDSLKFVRGVYGDVRAWWTTDGIHKCLAEGWGSG